MEILRENEKEMLEIKTTVTEMKGAFDALVSRLDMPRKELWAWGYDARNFQNWKIKRKKTEEKNPKTELDKLSKNCGTTTKVWRV